MLERPSAAKRSLSQACFLGDALACWSRFLQRGPSFSPSLRGLNFRQRVGDHDREIAELQDKSMVIREHRGSFLQLFYQRFQASMKLRHEVQCSLLEVGVQTLGKLKRPKRQPVAGISDVATDRIRELGRPVSYDETRWAFRTILRRKSLANCRRTIENVRVRSAEIRPYVLNHECYLSLLKSRVYQLQSYAQLESLIRRIAVVRSGRAPCEGGAFQWVQAPPGNRSSRKQPEQLWR